MMPVQFDQVNRYYQKPESMTDEQCSELPVWEGNYPDGQHVIISCWKLSKEDIEEVQRTGVVWLHVVGCPQPPVAIDTENPFKPMGKN